jgi:hypothetical protein
MAKPMVITLPFVLLLLDYWPLDGSLFAPSPFAVRQNAGEVRPPAKSGLSGDERRAAIRAA